jgi:hypothetical protein
MAKKRAEEEPDDLITLQEAAELRGYAGVSAVSRLISRERLRVFEKYGRKLVSRAEVKAYAPSQGGRPSEKARRGKK